MEILGGYLTCKNNESIYIPYGKVLTNGWGELGSTHLVGEETKPIPNRLQITWFSYTENKFYSDDFNLPHDLISKLFKEGFASPKLGNSTTYQNIIIGLAPGGLVSVWLAGEGIVSEVAAFKAHEANIQWTDFIDNPDITRAEFVESVLKGKLTNDFFSSIRSKGIQFELWNNYRIRYNWAPIFLTTGTTIDVWLTYFNGEREFINYESEKKTTFRQRTVVQKIDVRWKGKDNIIHFGIITLNEPEIFAAFAKLTANSASQNLKLQILINDADQSIAVSLSNEQYVLDLKDSDIKVYSN